MTPKLLESHLRGPIRDHATCLKCGWQPEQDALAEAIAMSEDLDDFFGRLQALHRAEPMAIGHGRRLDGICTGDE